jgi:CRP-like cAMP-binding protein
LSSVVGFINGSRRVELTRARVERICGFLEQRGVDAEGLFRIPGSKSAVVAAWVHFGDEPPLHLDRVNVHVVASAFKLYLRQQEERIITSSARKFLLPILQECEAKEGVESPSTIALVSEGLVACVDEERRLMLQRLTMLMARVKANADVNLMNLKNLVIVFSPNVITPNDDMLASLREGGLEFRFTALVAEHADTVFSTPYTITKENEALAELVDPLAVRLPPFTELDWHMLLSKAVVASFDGGAILSAAGSAPNIIFRVRAGAATVSVLGHDVDKLNELDMCGTEGLLGEVSSQETVVADGPVEAWCIDVDYTNLLLSVQPRLGYKFYSGLCFELAWRLRQLGLEPDSLLGRKGSGEGPSSSSAGSGVSGASADPRERRRSMSGAPGAAAGRRRSGDLKSLGLPGPVDGGGDSVAALPDGRSKSPNGSAVRGKRVLGRTISKPKIFSRNSGGNSGGSGGGSGGSGGDGPDDDSLSLPADELALARFDATLGRPGQLVVSNDNVLHQSKVLGLEKRTVIPLDQIVELRGEDKRPGAPKEEGSGGSGSGEGGEGKLVTSPSLRRQGKHEYLLTVTVKTPQFRVAHHNLLFRRHDDGTRCQSLLDGLVQATAKRRAGWVKDEATLSDSLSPRNALRTVSGDSGTSDELPRVGSNASSDALRSSPASVGSGVRTNSAASTSISAVGGSAESGNSGDRTVRVVRAYTARKADELTLAVDDVVSISRSRKEARRSICDHCAKAAAAARITVDDVEMLVCVRCATALQDIVESASDDRHLIDFATACQQCRLRPAETDGVAGDGLTIRTCRPCAAGLAAMSRLQEASAPTGSGAATGAGEVRVLQMKKMVLAGKIGGLEKMVSAGRAGAADLAAARKTLESLHGEMRELDAGIERTKAAAAAIAATTVDEAEAADGPAGEDGSEGEVGTSEAVAVSASVPIGGGGTASTPRSTTTSSTTTEPFSSSVPSAPVIIGSLKLQSLPLAASTSRVPRPDPSSSTSPMAMSPLVRRLKEERANSRRSMSKISAPKWLDEEAGKRASADLAASGRGWSGASSGGEGSRVATPRKLTSKSSGRGLAGSTRLALSATRLSVEGEGESGGDGGGARDGTEEGEGGGRGGEEEEDEEDEVPMLFGTVGERSGLFPAYCVGAAAHEFTVTGMPTADNWAKLFAVGREAERAQGDIIVGVGDSVNADLLYILTEGSVQVTCRELSTIVTGPVLLGELPFLLDTKSPCTLTVTSTRAKLVLLRAADVNDAFASTPALGAAFFKFLAVSLSARLRETRSRLVRATADEEFVCNTMRLAFGGAALSGML